MTGDFLFSSAGPIHGGIPDKCLKKTKLEGLDDDEDSACTVRKVNFARTGMVIPHIYSHLFVCC